MSVLLFLPLVLIQVCLLAWTIGFFRQMVLIQIYGDSPFVPTPQGTLAAISTSLDIQPGDVVYELGSGDGRFLLYCAQREPAARYIGIEKNPALLILARARAYLSGHSRRVSFLRESFYDADLTPATKIYAFLLPTAMNRMLPKLLKEFRGKLASRAFTFEDKEPSRVVALSEKKGAYGEHLLHVYDFYSTTS